MTGIRVGGSGSTEIVQANQPQPSAAVAQAHPHAVSPGSNPPLTASQSAAQAPESSAAGAARLPVAPRHLPTLEKFRAEQPTVKGTSTPTISANAALLIGSLLQSEKLPFEVMAARLSPERYALQQFHGSDLQQMLGRFAEPGHVPGKAETEQLIKGFAQSLADQLEHFQLMHDATAEAFAPGGLRDRNTLAVSQAALGEYAGRASKSIEAGLNHSLAVLDERIATLDSQLEGATEDSRPGLLMDRQALETARAMLSDLHADFCKSPEAKRLNAVAAHTQMDALIDKLNVDRNSVGGWKGFGPIVAAAVPQFMVSMLHLGYIRTATGEAMKDAVPEKSADASMKRALAVGLTAGVAHEGVTNLLKPMVQAGFQKTGLNERLNMVPLKGIDTDSVIPDPFELKNDNGALVRKTPEEAAEDKAFVESERAVLNQKKVQVSSTHPLGEMIPYGAFGGGQAVRQMLNDFNLLNGQTLSARAVTSGIAGAISATTQTIAQLNSTYVDQRGRKIPVFTPDRANADLGKDLAKGLDLREPAVRTAFYSKAVSGVQSAALNGALPPVAVQPQGASGTLSGGNILRNMALAATGSVSYLSTLYANQSVTAEAKALKEAGMGGAVPMLPRTESAWNTIRHPDRASLPHTFQPDTLGGVPRAVESAYHMGRGALQLPTQLVVDTLRGVEDGVSKGVSALRNSRNAPETPLPADNADPVDVELSSMEEGRRG